MKAWIAAFGAAALAGCASVPVVVSEDMLPAPHPGARTFAIDARDSGSAQAAAPEIARRLTSLGFSQSDKPDLVVIVGVAQRPRSAGTFSPSGCGSPDWVDDPGRQWLIGGGQVLSLSVHVVDSSTGRTLFRSTAYRRTSEGGDRSSATALADAVLSMTARRIRPVRPGSGCR